MKKLIPILIVCAIFTLMACLPEAEQNPVPEKQMLPPLTGSWTIDMSHTGGVAGIMRSIQINSDGSYTVEDRNASAVKQGILSGEQFFALTENYSAIEYAVPFSPEDFGCADCFVYEITVTTENAVFAVELNDISLPKSGFAVFVGSLREIMDQ